MIGDTLTSNGRFLLPVILILLMSGCTMLGPDFQRPEANVSNDWVSDENSTLNKESTDFKEWWTVFNDPILNGLINTAYQQNLDLQIAALRILEARAQLGIATGNQYPQLQSIGVLLRIIS